MNVKWQNVEELKECHLQGRKQTHTNLWAIPLPERVQGGIVHVCMWWQLKRYSCFQRMINGLQTKVQLKLLNLIKQLSNRLVSINVLHNKVHNTCFLWLLYNYDCTLTPFIRGLWILFLPGHKRHSSIPSQHLTHPHM